MNPTDDKPDLQEALFNEFAYWQSLATTDENIGISVGALCALANVIGTTLGFSRVRRAPAAEAPAARQPEREHSMDPLSSHEMKYIDSQLQKIQTLLQQLIAQGEKPMASLADINAKLATLATSVSANTNAEQSAVQLLQGLVAQSAAISTQLATAIANEDPTAIQAAADALDAQNTALAANTAALAAAVTSNTPAAPVAPAPTTPSANVRSKS